MHGRINIKNCHMYTRTACFYCGIFLRIIHNFVMKYCFFRTCQYKALCNSASMVFIIYLSQYQTSFKLFNL